MYGYIETGACRRPCRRLVGGVWFLAAAVREGNGLTARMCRRAVFRQMHRLGVRRCVMPEILWEEAARWGLLPVEIYPLRRAVLPQLLEQYTLLRLGCAVLRSPYTDGAVWEAASILARRVRYLALEIPRGGEELALALRSRYGLCPGALTRAAVTVSFAGAPCDGQTICLGDDCGRYQTVSYVLPDTLPPDCAAPEQLLAVLWEAEILKKEALKIKSITARP